MLLSRLQLKRAKTLKPWKMGTWKRERYLLKI
jgi:hypothetical protein